ncbi:MAG: hypothetical protein ABI242_00170 [Caulobacteraceae bacterium]
MQHGLYRCAVSVGGVSDLPALVSQTQERSGQSSVASATPAASSEPGRWARFHPGAWRPAPTRPCCWSSARTTRWSPPSRAGRWPTRFAAPASRWR